MMKIMIEETKDADKIAKLNESVQNLHYERYPEYFKPYSYESVLQYVKEQLSKDNYHAYIIGDQNNEYGYVLFFERNYMENPFRKAYKGIQIEHICIKKEYRNIGYGNKLMDSVQEYANKIGATQIELSYWELNTEAERFYKNAGYKRNISFVVKKL